MNVFRSMNDNFLKGLYKDHNECKRCPHPKLIIDFFQDLLGFLFPDVSEKQYRSYREFILYSQHLQLRLEDILCRNRPEPRVFDPEKVSNAFFQKLPGIHQHLVQDIDALYSGDPAAQSRNEVVRSYPGFFAIASYRVAHDLHLLGVDVIPRMITEHAHGCVGIDIHPAATIGSHFCIDHGTGVVIGETAVIGNHVKIYQGVTLGALSVDKSDASTKRHPTIEDHVVIYAGATVLGGETVVGHHSVVGGNVWLIRSIKPHTKIYYTAQMNNSSGEESDILTYKEATS